jgi:hypothetical protein
LSTNVSPSFGISQFSIQRAELPESSVERKHLLVKWSLRIGNTLINTDNLTNCGATGITFVDKDFVRHHQLEEIEFNHSRELEVIDGRPIES